MFELMIDWTVLCFCSNQVSRFLSNHIVFLIITIIQIKVPVPPGPCLPRYVTHCSSSSAVGAMLFGPTPVTWPSELKMWLLFRFLHLALASRRRSSQQLPAQGISAILLWHTNPSHILSYTHRQGHTHTHARHSLLPHKLGYVMGFGLCLVSLFLYILYLT